jgi:thymidylate kinase
MSLIIFDGIDKVGKSTLSVNFTQYLNKLYRDEDGLLKIDPHFGDFIWTKEPLFTTEEADFLNSPGYIDEYRRERIFFESRMNHQKLIAGKNVVCDRYIWSGLAYANKYSPGCFRFAKELYLSENLFIRPDLYIFVDTPPEICASRDAALDLDVLRELRESFLKTKDYIKTPIITIQAVDGEESTLRNLINIFDEHMAKTAESPE